MATIPQTTKVTSGIKLDKVAADADTHENGKDVKVTFTFEYCVTAKAFVRGGLVKCAKHAGAEVTHALEAMFLHGVEDIVNTTQTNLRKISKDF